MFLTLQSSDDINPNEKGRPNPVQVTLYQLKQSDIFIMSDYFALQNMDGADFSSSVDKVESYILAPGEKREVTLNIKDGMNAIGVVTAYRDITKAQWRVIYMIPNHPRERWYEKLWLTQKEWQPKANIHMKYLTTSIEKVE
ncbi:type VI secretion system lipoprotein TssJ [Serratia sp. NA_112.1]|uniref:type VI secretion system lipoprotein TssJ n=1 Tax=Serratia sp. NA_112.1 TaxID=3415665 RepID=UPI004046B572